MIKSNINISSNIYIRSKDDIKKDQDYMKNITGPERIKLLNNEYGSYETKPLSQTQYKIAEESATCSYAKNKELTHGPVMINGKLFWSCRCENVSCDRYSICTSKEYAKIIKRLPVVEEEKQEEQSLKDFFEQLGIVIQEDEVIFTKDKNVTPLEDEEIEYIEPTEQSQSYATDIISSYIELESPETIIDSPLDSHIILNSGPGTGKTYTIIQRLIYILAKNLCEPEEIYILCYTRAARDVIIKKINDAISEGIIQVSAQNICILTFDSYATYFLMEMKEQGVLNNNLDVLDYNARISLFNKYISAEDFENVKYFIVDEIQDLVNERAEMVLKILSHLNCGYLLAGDRCQAIYDYEADNDATLDSVEFYRRAEALFPDDMARYEITVNRRQSEALAENSLELRYSLLIDDIPNQHKQVKRIMQQYDTKSKIEKFIKNLNQPINQSTAILCRNNGEAEYVSGLLCKYKIPHYLNRGVNNQSVLPKWIADVFWDYCENEIAQSEFIDRFTLRCDSDMDPDILWNHLVKMSNSENNHSIDMSKLIRALAVGNNLPKDFYTERPLLTVSTIHKAKGSEFENVILIDSYISTDKDSAEEARIRYVALTRPKMDFQVMKKHSRYFKRIATGRVIETGLYNNYKFKTGKKFCKGIAIGLSGDIKSNSFVVKGFDKSVDLQEYINNNIKLYDDVVIERFGNSNSYLIIHNNFCIGELSEKMCNDLLFGINSTDYKNNLPCRLENIFINSITTEILKQISSDMPLEYQKSKICYGVELTGIAKLIFK